MLANDTDIDGGPDHDRLGDPARRTAPWSITGGGDRPDLPAGPELLQRPARHHADTFTYTLNGGDTATVSVTVTCVDDAPVAVDDTATVAEDAAATAIDVLANDTDVDGGPEGDRLGDRPGQRHRRAHRRSPARTPA